MFNRFCLAVIFTFTGLAFSGPTTAEEDCGELSIANLNWASAEIIAEIDKLILSAGYGCEVLLSGGETIPTISTMYELGKPDLIPEVWVSEVDDQLDAAVDEGELVIAAEILQDGGVEGWWIPRYTAEANPEINTVADALKRPDLFAMPEDPTVGGVYNCPPDWNCRTAMDNLYRAYGADEKGFTLVNTASAAGLDASIAKAHERKAGWLGYYWAPTSMLGRYDMIKLDMGEHDPEQWNSCTSVPDCANPLVNAWPASQVFSIVTSEFVAKAGTAMDYIATRQWSNKTVNEILAWMDDTQATGEEAAYHFLENYESIWFGWLPPDIAVKVKDRL